MPDFSCDVNITSAFTPCFHISSRCLQHINKIYKIFVLIFLDRSAVIKLTLFGTKNLLEVTSETLV